MKGVIFNLFEEFVEKKWGKQTLQELKKENSKTYMTVGNYPDEELVGLLQKLSSLTKKDLGTLLQDFGRFIFQESELLHKMYGVHFKKPNAKEFLKNMDSVHVQTTKAMPGATPPRFEYEEPDEKTLIMKYKSPRKLCMLLKGLIEGVLNYYREKATITETQCMNRGSSYCCFKITFM